MKLYFFVIIFNIFCFIFLKYLQWHKRIKKLQVTFFLLILQIVFEFFVISDVLIINYNSEREFYEKLDPDNDGHFQMLTEDDERVANNYFGDGGRNLWPFMNGVFCLILFLLLSIVSIVLDMIRYFIKKKNEEIKNV